MKSQIHKYLNSKNKIMSKKILFFLLLVCFKQVNAQICFSQSANITSTGGAFGLCSGDFDSDGILDLAVTDGTSKVNIFKGTGSVTFVPAGGFPVGNSPEGVISADFNKDGKADLAVANFNSSNISVLLGNGAGSFTATTNFSTASSAKALTSADFDGDNNLDLAVINYGAANVSILLGNGAGSFTLTVNLSVGTNPFDICNADFNSDGKKDLMVCNIGSNNVSFLAGNGNGTFQPAVTVAAGLNSPYSICTADFNIDGIADAAVANSGSNTVFVLTGNGSGSFTGVNYTLPGAASAPRGVCALDFNNDGNPDIVTADFSSNNIAFLAGPGFIPAGFNSVVGGSGARWIVSGDFNGDGAPDVANTNNTNGTLSAFINNLPFINITGSTAICPGNNTTLTGNGATTYSWSTGATTNTVTVSPTTATSYTLYGSNSSCSYTPTVVATVTLNALPTVSVTATSTIICNGSPITLSGTGNATTYTWTGGIINGVPFTPTVTATYTVTGTDANNCNNTATINIGVSTPIAPFICMLTADSLALNNIIYWDKTLYPNVDSFIVYRFDAFSTTYFKLGAVKKDSSQFTDIQRNIGGPNGGDPQYGSWQYKLAVKDTCGNISAKSPFHQSVFVQENFQNFSWNAYSIESGQSNPTTGYSFQRDDINTGTWHVLINTTGVSSTDPNYATFPNGNWRVEALGFNCTPTLRLANGTLGTIIRSKSNITNNRTTKIKQLGNTSNLTLYPNPNTGIFVIETNQKLHLQVFSIAGELVLNQFLESGKTTIDASVLQAGIYNINLSSNAGVINKRLVIVK